MTRKSSRAAALSCDLLVIGAGAAGVAAAVTAARQGLRVVVVERYGFAGGGAVAGLSGTVCGLYLASDSARARARAPEQIVFGFADEFCRRLSANGGLSDPQLYGKTWTRVHEPLAWRDTADQLLTEAGVQVIYHAVAVAALVEGKDTLQGVEVWTKEGMVDIRAGVTVDASGDADVVVMSGLGFKVGDNGRVQNPTMIFRLMGVDVARFRAAYGDDTIMPPEVSALIQQANDAGGYALPRSKIWLFPTTRPNELLCNCTRVVGSDGRELNSIFHRDFTEAEINGRRQIREYERFFKDHLAGCEAAFINDSAVQVGIRQSRQVEGTACLMNADILRAAKFPDAVARSAWPIEMHSGAKPRVEWILDDYYEVPYGCFVPARGNGLLVAGRCLSAEHEAVAAARVTAQCFSYGHAIGHAASLAVREAVPVRDVPAAAVRDRLCLDGALL